MALDGCGQLCKFILVIFNIIFAVFGFALLGIGMWLRFSGNTRGIFEAGDLNSTTFVIGVTVMIILGILMLIVVCFGDYGTCSENKCALEVFSALLGFMAAAEIAVGVFVYARSDAVAANIAEFYNTVYLLYVTSGDAAIGATLTFVHNLLHCCGVIGVKILDIAQHTCPEPDGFMEHIIMPRCPGVISDVFKSKVPLVMGLFIGIGVLLIIALICSIILSKSIRTAVSSPQYIILTPPAVGSPQGYPQDNLIPTSNPCHNQDPVVFTPLTMANLPVAEA